jgi:hypothetical protein
MYRIRLSQLLTGGFVDFLIKKLFGDKGYLSKKVFEELYEKGIKLIPRIRSNMKNRLMVYWEKIMLRTRGVIDSVHNRLKNG